MAYDCEGLSFAKPGCYRQLPSATKSDTDREIRVAPPCCPAARGLLPCSTNGNRQMSSAARDRPITTRHTYT